MNRRDFLKGLVAAAVATQLPLLPEAQAEPLIENTVNRLFSLHIPGRQIISISLADAGNGGYRAVANFGPQSEEYTREAAARFGFGDDPDAQYVELDHVNDGMGLAVFEPGSKWEREYAEKYPHHVIVNSMTMGLEDTGLTLSVYVKPDEDRMDMAQLAWVNKSPYVSTTIQPMPQVKRGKRV